MVNKEIENTNRSRFEMRAPKALTEKLMSYIAPDSGWVLVTDCEQYGDAFLDVIKAHLDTEFTLTTVNGDKAKELSDTYCSMDNVKLIVANSYEYGFADAKFDRIISIPPFGGRLLARDEKFICRETDLAALQNLIGHLKEDGELAIVLPAKITFGSGSVAKLREYIESRYSIREIDILPDALFLPYTAIRTYLFVFSSGKADSVLLRQYGTDKPISRKDPCSELILRKELKLRREEFAELNGWNVEQAFSEVTDEKKAYDSSSVRKVIMKDVATVFRGKAVNTKSEDGKIGVINISDITDMGIDYSNVDRMDAEDRKIEKYLLKEGDVLVSTRGTVVKAAVVEDMPMRCIPSVNLIVIRPGEMIRGTYLKLFLESPVGIQMLESLQRGGSVMNINYKDVAGLEIPAPPLEMQDELIAKYDAGLKAYKATVLKAEKKWNKTRQEVQAGLF